MAILSRNSRKQDKTVRTGRGGRKEKIEEQQLNQTVKTTLTKADLEGLQEQYRRDTVAQKISFAEYIRQRLLAKSDTGRGADERSSLLSIQLELAEISERITQLLGEMKRQGTSHSVEKTLAVTSEGAQETGTLQQNIGLNLDRIEAAIKQVSQWLYDSSPEKI